MKNQFTYILILLLVFTSGKPTHHRTYKRRYGNRKLCPEYKTVSNVSKKDVSSRRLNALFSKKLTVSKLRISQFTKLFSKIQKLENQAAMFKRVHLTPSYLKKFPDKPRRIHRKSKSNLHSSKNVRKNIIHYDRNIPVFH